MYDALTEKGYRVFFSRISLEKMTISWISKLNGVKRLVEEEEKWFASDKNLNRAIRFSADSDRIRTVIEDAKQKILNRMYLELETLKSEEEKKKSDAKAKCDEYYDSIRNGIVKEIETMKDETYIDIYCPECHSELSYLYWVIKEGELMCPICDAQFVYDEKYRKMN